MSVASAFPHWSNGTVCSSRSSWSCFWCLLVLPRSSRANKREAGGAVSGQHPAGPGPPPTSEPLWLRLPLPQAAAEDGRPPSAGHRERSPGSKNQKDWVGDLAPSPTTRDLQRHVLALSSKVEEATRKWKTISNTVTDWIYIYIENTVLSTSTVPRVGMEFLGRKSCVRGLAQSETYFQCRHNPQHGPVWVRRRERERACVSVSVEHLESFAASPTFPQWSLNRGN